MPGAADNAVRSARPTIRVDGRDEPSLSEGLLSLLIVEDTGGLYRCEASFGNWGSSGGSIGFLYFDRRTLDFGKQLQVKMAGQVLFDGRITALEAHFTPAGQRELKVLAEDRLQDLRMTRRTRTFLDMSDADVFRQIASDHSLSPQVSLTGATHKVLAQVNQSDLAFLRDRARCLGVELWVEGTTLHAQPRSGRQSTAIELSYPASLREFSVLADVSNQRSAVRVSGWDIAGKSAISEEAGEDTIGGELDGGVSAASVLANSLGQRKEVLAHGVPDTGAEARAHAEAYFRAMARRFVVGRGTTETDGRVRVGATVDLRGVGGLFNGKYFVSQVQHVFDGARGARTEFVGERAGLGRP